MRQIKRGEKAKARPGLPDGGFVCVASRIIAEKANKNGKLEIKKWAPE